MQLQKIQNSEARLEALSSNVSKQAREIKSMSSKLLQAQNVIEFNCLNCNHPNIIKLNSE